MKIHWKITLLLVTALTTLSLLSAVGSYSLLQSYANNELATFKAGKIEETKVALKNQVEIAESVIQESLALSKSGKLSEAEAKERALSLLAKLRYDNGVGYFWVNDTSSPIPTMIMHPISPALNGKKLDDAKYNCALGKAQNLFQAMVEVSAKEGQGYVDYLWPKPNKGGGTDPQPKISFVKQIEAWGWVVGTGVYVDSIDAAVAVSKASSARTFKAFIGKILLMNLILLLVVAVAMSAYVIRSICNPILRLVQFVNGISAGNLHQVLTEKRSDEIGQTMAAVSSMADKINKIFKASSNNAGTLAVASEDLLEISTGLSSGISNMSDMYLAISGAIEEMGVNMMGISTAMQKSSSGIELISSSANDMQNTIDSISHNTEQAKQVTGEVVVMATNTSALLADLGNAADEITKISETITDISERTNLLALNATIEAARAGEAGKGFAVVASEIKGLANTVASSTKEIRSKVNRVQASTSATVNEISTIIKGIETVNRFVTSISTEMEAQKVATNEIAQSISQTARGVSEITENISQSTIANRSVAEDISRISGVSQNISISSLELKELAVDTNRIAKSLSSSVHQFDLGEEKFDIAAIKRAHLRWKKNLVTVLLGQKKIRVEEVTLHTQCDFGKWYFGTGQIFTTNVTFQEIGVHHEHVHAYAREIVGLYNQGKVAEAERKMSSFEEARTKLFDCLDALYVS